MKIFIACICSFALIAFSANPGRAQDDYTSYRWKAHWIPVWTEMTGSFLEPNRFSTVYDSKPERLRIEVGYGGEILRVSSTAVGAEGLIWSGLKAISGFRFPVETADYFFGFYSIFPLPVWGSDFRPWRMRFRLSHISSHYVDGIPTADSIIGGSSSHYSREFASLEAEFDESDRSRFRLTLGLKYVFHEITKVEQRLQFPAAIDVIAYKNPYTQLFATVSAAGGPSLPIYSAGITLRTLILGSGNTADLYGEYHSGNSRYGIDANARQDGFEIGLRIGAQKVLEK